MGLSWWLSGKESACKCRRPGFDPWVMKIPWRREWQPTAVFLPGKSYGQRSLVGYSPWGRKESDTTEHVHAQASIKMGKKMLVNQTSGFSPFQPQECLVKGKAFWLTLGALKILQSDVLPNARSPRTTTRSFLLYNNPSKQPPLIKVRFVFLSDTPIVPGCLFCIDTAERYFGSIHCTSWQIDG